MFSSTFFTNKKPDRVYYKKHSSPSRVDRCIETESVIAIVELMRLKVQELKSAAETLGAATPDYSKFNLMNSLLERLDEEISAFNELPHSDETTSEYTALHELIEKLSKITSDVYDDQNKRNILLEERNSNRKMASDASSWTLVGGPVAYASYAALSFIPGAILSAAGLAASHYFKKYTNLYAQNPRSFELVKELSSQLTELGKSIQPKLSSAHGLHI